MQAPKGVDSTVVGIHYKRFFCSLFLLSLLISNSIFLYMYLNTSTEKVLDIDQYPLIDPARHFIPQSHYIVNIQPLRENIRAKSKELSAKYGLKNSIYIEFLNTGANISINPDEYIWPASLTKLPLALAVMKKIENNVWTLNNELVLMLGDADNKSGNPDDLYSKPIGTRFKIEYLLEKLLIDSDNTAYNILLRNVTEDELGLVILELGAANLFTQDGKISAKEYSRVLRSLYTASFLTRQNSQKILTWLDNASFNDFISYDIHQYVQLPHKYGIHIPNNAFSDSGIVYVPNRPYIISIMVEGDRSLSSEVVRGQVEEFMRDVSAEAYKYFSEYNING
jgi:hypothetical protein